MRGSGLTTTFADKFLANMAALAAGSQGATQLAVQGNQPRPGRRSPRLGASDVRSVEVAIISRVLESLGAGDDAPRAAEDLLRRLEVEFEAAGPVERMLVEHLAMLHVQLLQVRAMWVSAAGLEDTERLTRLQTRLSGEFGRIVALLIGLRAEARPVIAQANISVARQQVVTQQFTTNEVGAKYAAEADATPNCRP